VEQNPKWHHKDVWDHTMLVVSKVPATPLMRWAALFHDIGKPITYEVTETGVHFYRHELVGVKIWKKVAERLKLSNELRDEVAFLIRRHLQPTQVLKGGSDKAVRKLCLLCLEQGSWAWDALLDLNKADCTSGKTGKQSEVEQAVEWLRERPKTLFATFEKPKLPTGLGNVLMKARNKKPGPWIREEMNRLMRAMETGRLNTRPTIEECLALLGYKQEV
jgi:putative nucleotidyltransferase with HDIG domain